MRWPEIHLLQERGEPKEVLSTNHANGCRLRQSPVWVHGIAVRDASRLPVRHSVPGELRPPPFCKHACSMEACSLTGVRLRLGVAVPVAKAPSPDGKEAPSIASAARSRPGKGMRSRLAWMSSSLPRPPLGHSPKARRSRGSGGGAANTLPRLRPCVSVRVVRVVRGKEILLLIDPVLLTGESHHWPLPLKRLPVLSLGGSGHPKQRGPGSMVCFRASICSFDFCILVFDLRMVFCLSLGLEQLIDVGGRHVLAGRCCLLFLPFCRWSPRGRLLGLGLG